MPMFSGETLPGLSALPKQRLDFERFFVPKHSTSDWKDIAKASKPSPGHPSSPFCRAICIGSTFPFFSRLPKPASKQHWPCRGLGLQIPRLRGRVRCWRWLGGHRLLCPKTRNNAPVNVVYQIVQRQVRLV